jgi:hypothetical protein
MFPNASDFFGENFWYSFQISEEEGYFLSEPFGINSLYLGIDGEIGLTFFIKKLDIGLCKREFSVFIFWFPMYDDGITRFDSLFKERCMEKDTL